MTRKPGDLTLGPSEDLEVRREKLAILHATTISALAIGAGSAGSSPTDPEPPEAPPRASAPDDAPTYRTVVREEDDGDGLDAVRPRAHRGEQVVDDPIDTGPPPHAMVAVP